MKVKAVDGLMRVTLDRQDWSYLLLAICRRLDEPKSTQVIKHWRNTLDEHSWDLVMDYFELTDIPVYIDRDEALKFSDDLVDALFPPTKKKKHLKIAKICVNCQQAYFTEDTKQPHLDCEVAHV